MTKNEYGSVEFYSEHFADILADVANYSTPEENEKAVKNILRGFQMAIQDWLDYHSAAVVSYSQLRNELIAEDRKAAVLAEWAEDAQKYYKESDEEENALLNELEEETLPEIPDFPSVLK